MKHFSPHSETLYLQQCNFFLQLIFCVYDWGSFQPGELDLLVTARQKPTWNTCLSTFRYTFFVAISYVSLSVALPKVMWNAGVELVAGFL